MNPIVKNILAVVAGALIGSAVNMGIVMLSGSMIPPPEGADMTTPEGLKAAMPLMEAKHFISPFLAHALGTFAGAFLAVKIATSSKLRLAMIIGLLFMAGGISAALMIPAPTWFLVLDLVLAYIPMAWLGGKLGMGLNRSSTAAV